MKRLISLPLRGFTLIETIMAVGLAVIVGVFVVNFLSTSSLLFAKNVSTNLTHSSIQTSLDRLVQDVSQVNGQLTLINTAGTNVGSGPAAGVRFDVLRGYPYVVVHPGGSGLKSNATTLTLQRTTDPVVAPPLPQDGDILLLDGATNIRLKIQSATAGSTSGTPPVQSISVTLKSAVGTEIPWSAGTSKTAKLVRPAAYVVIPVSGRNELRYYPTAENITNFATSSDYKLVLNNIGTATEDKTPFSFASVQGRNFLRTTLRVRSSQYDSRLLTKESNKFSTVNRVEFIMNPRGN